MSENSDRFGKVITIDGPAGSGKSSTARAVAKALGFRHLNSGNLYRAVTCALLNAEVPAEEWPNLSAEDLGGLGVEIGPGEGGFSLFLNGRPLTEELVSKKVTAAVSSVSALPGVRDWLLAIQRGAAEFGGLVTDGRDMGTTVFPEAGLKVFLIADPHVRARRRLLERGRSNPGERELQEEEALLLKRDHQDSAREASPLRQPEDALVIDTSDVTFNRQVDLILTAWDGLTLS